MDSARGWLQKLQSRDRMKDSAGDEKEGGRPPTHEEAPSSVTKQRVAAAKQYIENHYKEKMKNLEERKER